MCPEKSISLWNCLNKSTFFGNFPRKLKYFRKLPKKSKFFGNFTWKIEIFCKITWKNRNFSEICTEKSILCLWNCLKESKFVGNFSIKSIFWTRVKMWVQVNEMLFNFFSNRFQQAFDDWVPSIAEYLILGRTE